MRVGNVVLALYSTVTIAGIVVTVVGIGAGGIMGWDLGTTEAIAAVIVIGFSVDYCVHLANAYIENDAKDRETRTRIALTTMGISVTAGAITTIIAGVFLSLCILTFFVKFSFLICWTIISSYLWAGRDFHSHTPPPIHTQFKAAFTRLFQGSRDQCVTV